MDLIQKHPNFRFNNIHKNIPLTKLLAQLNIIYHNIRTQNKEWILYDAHKSYLSLIKKYHPDKRGNLEISKYLNTIWTTIRERLNKEQKFKNHYDYQTIPLQEIKCVYCGKKFEQKYPLQKFCNLKHKGKYHNWGNKRV